MKGHTVTFGERSVTFYPLALSQIRDMADEVEQLRKGMVGADLGDRARFESILKLFAASAQRGKPTVTVEEVGAVVDMENIHGIMRVLLGQRVREIDGAGGDASAPTSPQTGGTSSPPSPQAQDGASPSLVS